MALLVTATGCTLVEAPPREDRSSKEEGRSSEEDGISAAEMAHARQAAADYAIELHVYTSKVEQAVQDFKPPDKVKGLPSLEKVLDDPPELEPVPGAAEASDRYAAVAKISRKVSRFVAELRALGQVNGQYADGLWKLYGRLSPHLYGAALDANSYAYDKIWPIVIGEKKKNLSDAEQHALIRNILIDGVKRRLQAIRRMQKKVSRVHLPGAIGASVKNFLHDYLDRNQEFGRQYIEYLHHRKAEADLYSSLWAGSVPRLDYPAWPALYEWRYMVKGLVRGLSQLASQAVLAEGGTPGPSVGDTYRALILRMSRKGPDTKDGESGLRLQQAWLLYRIRELEGTPRKRYRKARAAIYLQQWYGEEKQTPKGWRSYQNVLVQGLLYLGQYGSEPGAFAVRAVQDLFSSFTVPTVMKSQVERLRRLLDAMESEASAKGRQKVLSRQFKKMQDVMDDIIRMLGKKGLSFVEPAVRATDPTAWRNQTQERRRGEWVHAPVRRTDDD